MKHSHMILIAVGVIAIGAAAMLVPKHTAHNAGNVPAKDSEAIAPVTAENLGAALVIDGEPVDPLCFVNNSGEEETLAHPVTGCTEHGLVADPSLDGAPLGPNFYSTAYISNTGALTHGVVGYRYLGDIEGHKAIWLVENGGGSGVFSSIVLMDIMQDEDGKKLQVVKGVAFGDRCNGGVSDAQIVNGALVYERDVTPYTLMSLTGDPDRDILQAEEMDQLPSCAVCCYGQAHFEGERFTGILFDKRLPEGIENKAYSDAQPVEKCFDDHLASRLKGDKFYLNADDFAAFVGEVEQSCFPQAAGEQ